MGIFQGFRNDLQVELIGVEAGGLGLETGKHSASIGKGSKGILHGSLSYVLQDQYGQILETHSVAAGLDYPGVGPEHAYLRKSGRVTYTTAHDDDALEAFYLLSRVEGIIPALESAHALAEVVRLAPTLPREAVIVVNLSGRGDKDVDSV